MKLSLIVPTRYRSKMLQYFLMSLKRNSAYEHEVIIVCDIFTSWQTYKFLQENNMFYYQVNYCNWYRMLNFGSDKASNEYLALCQDDVLFGYHWDEAISKYLSPMTLVSPTFLEHVNGHYFGSYDRDGGRHLEDFNFEEFETYCKNHNQEGIHGDVKHPMIIHRDTFNRLGKFTCFTGADREHLHHESGFKYRLQQIGGCSIAVKNSFVYHIPNCGGDENIPRFGYEFYKDSTHIPLECKHCGVKRPGVDLPRQELDSAINLGYWICQQCRK